MTQEISKILTQLADHERRLAFLEGTSKPSAPKRKAVAANTDYSGAVGGVKYLISQGFFKEKRNLTTIREQLDKESYRYSRQAVHGALKTLSKQSGSLVSLKEGKHKAYAERK